MDNVASKVIQDFLVKEGIVLQPVEPHNYRANSFDAMGAYMQTFFLALFKVAPTLEY